MVHGPFGCRFRQRATGPASGGLAAAPGAMEGLPLWEILNTTALFVVGFSVAAFRRTVDKLQRQIDEHSTTLHDIRVDVATLKEWRNGHDARHTELIDAVRELRTLVVTKFDAYDENIRRFYETYELTPKPAATAPPRRRART